LIYTSLIRGLFGLENVALDTQGGNERRGQAQRNHEAIKRRIVRSPAGQL
jgi:hypothetical protein